MHHQREERGAGKSFDERKSFGEIKREVLNFFGLPGKDEGIFWAKLDTLIEKNCFFARERRVKWLEEGLKEFFPEREWRGVPREVMDYARSEKNHFLIYKDNGAENMESNVYIFRLLVDTAYKMAFVREPELDYMLLRDNVINLIGEKVPLYLLDRQEVNLRIHKFNRLYMPDFGTDKEVLAGIFSKGMPVLEKIFEDAAAEYVRRKSSASVFKAFESGSEVAREMENEDEVEEKEEKVAAGEERKDEGQGYEEIKGAEEEKGGEMPGSKPEKTEDLSGEDREELLKKYETTIMLLQEELEEYKNECLDMKREMESLYEYAGQRYETAVKDFVFVLNKPEYGYVLSQLFLFAFGKKEFSLQDIQLLLRNFFVALENMGVKPSSAEKIGVKEVFAARDIGASFILDRDIKDGKEFTGEVIMPGWQYKGKSIILPVVGCD